MPAYYQDITGGSERLKSLVRIGRGSLQHHHHQHQDQHHQSDKHNTRHKLNGHAQPPASLEWEIESPPAIFFGTPDESTGALVSGQLYLTINGVNQSDSCLAVGGFYAWMGVRVRHKRPFHSHCDDCASQFTELKRWSLLSQPAVLTAGRHQFPFSILLGGHLPPTLDNSLVSITYEYFAEVFAPRPSSSSSQSSPLSSSSSSSSSSAFCTSLARLERTLLVRRSLPAAHVPSHSGRIFPPTNIRADVYHTQVLYPSSAGTLTIRLTGLLRANPATGSLERYQVRRVGWKLEESIRTVAPACLGHETHGSGGKAVVRSETRALAEHTFAAGWKENTDSPGSIEFETPFLLDNSGRSFGFDSRSRDGTEVTHALVVELVVASGRDSGGLSATAASVLRASYPVVLTDLPDDGISWDNECPPVYEDVPPKPPGYHHDQA